MKKLALAISLLTECLKMASASDLHAYSLVHDKAPSKTDSTVYYMYDAPNSEPEDNIPEFFFKCGFVTDGYL